jgi:PTS system nitrogen regulatory IIA component
MTRTNDMGVHHCFESGTVVFRIESLEKTAALRELIRRAPVFSQILDLSTFEESVLSREKIQSTGLGHGVAVAHGRSGSLSRVLMGLGVSLAGIPFDSPDGKPVHLLFVIASPPETSLDYLQALSSLVRVIRDCSLREALLEAVDPRQIEAAIRSAFALSRERIGRIAYNPTT